MCLVVRAQHLSVSRHPSAVSSDVVWKICQHTIRQRSQQTSSGNHHCEDLATRRPDDLRVLAARRRSHEGSVMPHGLFSRQYAAPPFRGSLGRPVGLPRSPGGEHPSNLMGAWHPFPPPRGSLLPSRAPPRHPDVTFVTSGCLLWHPDVTFVTSECPLGPWRLPLPPSLY